jgi:tRNA dimethylallyltransferase
MDAGYDMIVITGPTASGKTRLSASLASRIGGELISADSRQVYKGMDIGTGKDYDDYIIDGKAVPVHLIDIVDAGAKYNVYEYQKDFLRVFNNMRKRGVFPVVCGGSGMYVDSIISGYRLVEVPPDEGFRKEMEAIDMSELVDTLKSYKILHNSTDIDSRKRVIRALEIERYYLDHSKEIQEFPVLNCFIAGINVQRDRRRELISVRLSERLENGLIEEVARLMNEGVSSESLIYYGLEYKYITLYLLKQISYDNMKKSLEIAIHQFAKRQMTWFRGMERKGIKIHWIDESLDIEEKIRMIRKLSGL